MAALEYYFRKYLTIFTAGISAIIIIAFFPIWHAYAGGDAAALNEHWKRPINAGSLMPAESLFPEFCAKCHREQYEDWHGALHSKSVGPGLLSQFGLKSGPNAASSCYYCHAPLSVQDDESGNEKLKSSGVSCAVCHVRDNMVFGPTRRDPNEFTTSDRAGYPSARNGLFLDSEFCAACHQLDDGFELNGKLLVNTYREWKDSGYEDHGITCQSCHMPGRRHLFRGIHDPDMVRSGVTFEVERTSSRNRKGARLKLINSAVGHYFPTYATPLVVIKGFLTDAKGNVLKGTVKEAKIGRRVTLDLSREIFDTRIPPHKSFEFEYSIKRSVKADMLVFEVMVFPDEFYSRFFESAISKKDSGMNKAELKEAFRNTSESGYMLFRKVQNLLP